LSACASKNASASLGSFISPTMLRMPSSVMNSAPTPDISNSSLMTDFM